MALSSTMRRSAMPTLVPLPIPTRGLSWWRAYWNWLVWRRDFATAEDWHHRLPTGEDVMIPAGFVFDGASVPRLAPALLIVALMLLVGLPVWAALPALVVALRLSPIGILLIPGLLHDYGYQHRHLLAPDGTVAVRIETRRGWDVLFHEVCHTTNGLVVLDLICALLLGLFGGFAWRKHRRAEGAP